MVSLPDHQGGHTQPRSSSTFSTPQAELEHVDHQTREVEAPFLRRLAAIHSPIYALPTELLSRIFIFVCTVIPDPEVNHWDWELALPFNSSPLLSCSISFRWREVALITPDLWGQLCLPYASTMKTSPIVALIQHYINHAGVSGVIMDTSPPGFLRSAKHDDAIINGLLQTPFYTTKLSTLRLYNASLVWITTIPQLRSIHTLCIETLEENRDLDILSLSELRRLSVLGTWGSIKLPPNIHYMTLYNTSSAFNLAALQQSPNLVAYRQYPACIPDQVDLPSPLTLSKLESLVWSSHSDYLLSRLHFPSLKTLCFRDFYSSEPTSAIEKYRQLTSEATIISLKTGELDFNSHDFRRLFSEPSLSALRTLGLFNSPIEALQDVIKSPNARL